LRRGRQHVLALVSSGDGGVARFLTSAVMSLALLAGATSCPAQDPKPTSKCHEGDPCWNCHTMGNKKCGPGDKGKL
jgi:hypothetical protein